MPSMMPISGYPILNPILNPISVYIHDDIGTHPILISILIPISGI